MPRKAKDEISLNEGKKVSKSTKKTSTASTDEKPKKGKIEKVKNDIEKTVSSKKTEVKKVNTTKSSKKDDTEKKVVKKAPSKKTETKKTSTKTTTKAKSSRTKAQSLLISNVDDTKKSVQKKRSVSKRAKKIEVLEYYDLPYRYNQTIVKVLAQTPNILFVYWDISDEDKQNYINQYGEFFFNDTKPVLIVYNDTKKYSFEIDINDYANSWYLHILDSNCKYRVELGRRPINKYAKIDNYLYISSSNNMDAPNDHILFDTLNNNVYFRNVKTNITTHKDITLSFFSRIGKVYNIKDFYKQLYKDEDINFEKINLKNMPSS